jgi:hypothetical protein
VDYKFGFKQALNQELNKTGLKTSDEFGVWDLEGKAKKNSRPKNGRLLNQGKNRP